MADTPPGDGAGAGPPAGGHGLAAQFGPPARRLGRELRRWPFDLVVNSVAAAAWCPSLLRVALYRLAGLHVAWGAGTAPGVFVRGTALTVGGGTTVNARCLIDCSAPVTIGSDCGIGYGVSLITSNHRSDDPAVRAGERYEEPITIGDGVWLGSGVTVLPGVTIGDGVIVGAGAVVHRDCAPHTLYGGVPARVLRELDGPV